jgi:DNA (cytosine-5)-methyltransferase 1
MKYLSVCSGIEAASAAWHHLGWEAVGFAQIDHAKNKQEDYFNRYACAVLAHHYPTVTNYKDIRNITKENLNGTTFDLLVGGTPCQSFSIAGKRRGLDDKRGALTFEYIRILKDFQPRWFIWENVKGAVSSSKGRDFHAVIGAFADAGYCVGWRVLSGPEFGVPQQRNRVFVVGCLGATPEHIGEVLFKSKVDPRTLSSYRPSGSTEGYSSEHMESLLFSCNDCRHGTVVSDRISPTLIKAMGKGGKHIPMVAQIDDPISGCVTKHRAKGACFEDFQQQSAIPYTDGTQWRMRKLTPLETERLMGFPDHYTAVPWLGKSPEDAPDTPRYAALGNSMIVPTMEWLGRSIQIVENNLAYPNG